MDFDDVRTRFYRLRPRAGGCFVIISEYIFLGVYENHDAASAEDFCTHLGTLHQNREMVTFIKF